MRIDVRNKTTVEPSAGGEVGADCVAHAPDESFRITSAETVSEEPVATSCPPPLMWRDVLTKVENDVRVFRFRRADAEITVRTFGRGKPLFVCLGLLGDWRLFALTSWLLRDEFQTVIIDPPARDGTQLKNPRYRVDQLAADLLGAADQMGAATFSLFATSFGSPVALQVMSTAGGRIETAVIHAPVIRVRISPVEKLLVSLGRFSRRTMESVPLFDRIQNQNHRRWFPPFDSSRWEFLRENIGRTPVGTLCQRLAALRSWDHRERQTAIRVPTLLLHSEGDGSAGVGRAEHAQRLIPNSRIELLPHCGHFPFLTHPHLLANAVKEYHRS